MQASLRAPIDESVRLAADTARRGELAVLRWGDLDGRVLSIKRNLSLEVLGPTKTNRSRRLTLVATTAAMIVDHFAARQQRVGCKPVVRDWVFAPDYRRRPTQEQISCHSFDRLRRAAGVPDAALHRLRPSVGTHLVGDGKLLKAKGRLGHRDPATTLRHYAHATPSMTRPSPTTWTTCSTAPLASYRRSTTMRPSVPMASPSRRPGTGRRAEPSRASPTGTSRMRARLGGVVVMGRSGAFARSPVRRQRSCPLRPDASWRCGADMLLMLTGSSSSGESTIARAVAETAIDGGAVRPKRIGSAGMALFGRRRPADGGGAGSPPSPGADPPPALASAPTYAVERSDRSAVGDGATVWNVEIASVALAWKRPSEVRADLAAGAVGREDELAKLQVSLASRDAGGAIVIYGASGVGKSTLAAMFSQAHGAGYPGGVLWVQLGPTFRDPGSANAALQRLATYAYGGDPQVLEGRAFSPEDVAALLAGHGPTLAVLDDAWHEAPVATLRRALPPGTTILVTTFNADLARQIARSADGLLELDVLSRSDAEDLVLRLVDGIDRSLVDELARAMGYHPHALIVGAGWLARRGRARRAEDVAELVRLMGTGANIGSSASGARKSFNPADLSLRLIYDSFAESNDGIELQVRLRALGVLAASTPFPTAIAAALWEIGLSDAIDCLVELKNLGLVKDVLGDAFTTERWLVHPVVRAFSRSVMTDGEGEDLSRRHARAFRSALGAAEDANCLYALAPDVPNLRQAFAWAIDADVNFAASLAGAASWLMIGQKLGREYATWTARLLERAQEPQHRRSYVTLASLHGAALLGASLTSASGAATLWTEAAATYRQALLFIDELPLGDAEAEEARLFLTKELSKVPRPEGRPFLLHALEAYDRALESAPPGALGRAAIQEGRAELLEALAEAPGEDRDERLHESLAALDEAELVTSGGPDRHAALLRRRGSVLLGLAGSPREDRHALLLRSLSAYEDAAEGGAPDPAGWNLLGRGRALVELSTVHGESQRDRLHDALAAIDAAEALVGDDVLAGDAVQELRAEALALLADVAGEDRSACLLDALAAYDDVLALRASTAVASENAHFGRGQVLLRLDRGADALAALYDAYISFGRLGNDRRQVEIRRLWINLRREGETGFDELWERVFGQPVPAWLVDGDDGSTIAAAPLLDRIERAEALVPVVHAWVTTPTWEEAAEYFLAHADELLSPEAEVTLALFGQHIRIQIHTDLVERCRRLGAEEGFRLVCDDDYSRAQRRRHLRDGDGRAMLPYARALASDEEDTEAAFYLAIAKLMVEDFEGAEEAAAAAGRLATADQRKVLLATLDEIRQDQPEREQALALVATHLGRTPSV